jgi:hypothetical protein
MRVADEIPTATQTATSDRVETLCDLLTAQVVCAREGNLGRLEQLCMRADDIVAQMKETDCNCLISGPQRERLEQLYKELALTLGAERADVDSRLKQLRQVKRAVGAYGRKTRP